MFMVLLTFFKARGIPYTIYEVLNYTVTLDLKMVFFLPALADFC